MEIIDRITNNGILRGIYFFPKKFQYDRENAAFEAEAELRRQGKDDSRYSKLREFSGKYKGKRCFIVATGPSLTISDLEKIKGEYSFGMNSICMLFDKTSWRPSFYGIQDVFVYEKMKDIINNTFSVNDIVFTGSTLNCKKYIEYPVNAFYHKYAAQCRRFFVKFSDNAYSEVYDGSTITYSLIQIAVYMGFKEIYLLGVDCSYQKGKKNHVVESGHIDKYDYLLNYKRMVISYEKAKEYADSHDIHIINCTRGGMLEVFPRKSLEEVLNISDTVGAK